MTTAGMRRYRHRSPEQSAFIGSDGEEPLALDPEKSHRLEIGFGHGEFITAMAAAHPQEQFLGIEFEPLRVTKTAHKCAKAGLSNVTLFGGDAQRFARFRLPAASLQRIYILFPDPWPKTDHRRRRLVDRQLLAALTRAAAPGCRLIFASDTHNYAMQVLSNCTTLPGMWRNLYAAAGGYRIDIPTRFPTLFETYKKEEGCTVAYLMLQRTATPAANLPPWPSGGFRARHRIGDLPVSRRQRRPRVAE